MMAEIGKGFEALDVSATGAERKLAKKTTTQSSQFPFVRHALFTASYVNADP